MLYHSILHVPKPQCRRHFFTTTASRAIKPIPILPDATLETFRSQAFTPALPVLLPGQFTHLPAIQNWFSSSSTDPNDSNNNNNNNNNNNKNGRRRSLLNRTYLEQFASTIIPLEITYEKQFTRIEQPLSFFLEYATSTSTSTSSPSTFTSATSNPKIYLAQASLSLLPLPLQQDLPTPTLVTKTDKGDIYASSIWLGPAPTYTPLHRDPNPNLFVQLSGRKVVRMFNPRMGLRIFDAVQERIGRPGGGSATMRGEEMMEGEEREVLEEEVWGKAGAVHAEECWEAEVGSGDGLFIPKGWWHSIRSTHDEKEDEMIGSVNWWFR